MPLTNASSLDFSKIREIFQRGQILDNDDANNRNETALDFQSESSNDVVEVDDSTKKFPGFSQEERKQLIYKIMEKRKSRKQQNNQLTNLNLDESNDHSHQSFSTIDNRNNQQQQSTWDGFTNSDSETAYQEPRFLRRGKLFEPLGTMTTRERRRAISAPRPLSSRSSSSLEEAELTFRPAIKPLPQYYGPRKQNDAPFYDRVSKWQREKSFETFRKKKEIDQNLLSNCTFQPRINRNSQKAIAEIRSQGAAHNDISSIHDRLYKTHEIMLEQRAQFLEAELRRERREVELECPFRPHLSTDPTKFPDTVPKYNRHIPKHYLDHQHANGQTNGSKDCTFQPKVSSVSVIKQSPYCNVTSAEPTYVPIYFRTVLILIR